MENELYIMFRKAAGKNGESADEILSSFMKDYIVSDGHPEQVVNRWPWNRKTNTAKEG